MVTRPRFLLALVAGLAMLAILVLFVLLPETGHFAGADNSVDEPVSAPTSQPTSASADLSGPSDCVRRPFRARVTGQELFQVVFFVDGQERNTVGAKDGRTTATLRIDPRGQDRSVHRVTATVRFTGASAEPERTLRLVYRRCDKASTPRFTR